MVASGLRQWIIRSVHASSMIGREARLPEIARNCVTFNAKGPGVSSLTNHNGISASAVCRKELTTARIAEHPPIRDEILNEGNVVEVKFFKAIRTKHDSGKLLVSEERLRILENALHELV